MSLIGAFRRLLMAPSLASVGFAGRGFPGPSTPATEHLEAIPQSVVCGFEWGIENRGLVELERRLSLVDPEMRGFAYEGATMASTIRDTMPGRGGRTRELLLGPGQPHIFLAYIGIGFALARLPRALWKKAMPDLDGSPFHPTMSWLVIDGYGFDLAYFHTERWVDRQEVPEPYPWAGAPEYFPRAVDQGIGRALWFIHGGRAEETAQAVAAFPESRCADLWGGVGLAATFAGGCPEQDLAGLRRSAGRYRPDLAVGVVFAATARAFAEYTPEHTEAAARALAGMTAQEAVAIGVSTEPKPQDLRGRVPYEAWRQNIRGHFLSASDDAPAAGSAQQAGGR